MKRTMGLMRELSLYNASVQCCKYLTTKMIRGYCGKLNGPVKKPVTFYNVNKMHLYTWENV